MRRRALFVSLIGICLALSVRAQSGADNDPDGAQGYVNNVFHHSSVDSINLYNGQLTIPIPIGPEYPIGPTLKFQAVLTYNSRGSDFSRTGRIDQPIGLLAGDPALGMGWTFTLGAIKTCIVNNADALCYFAPDGSQHVFGPASGGYSKTVDATQFYLHDLALGGPYEMWDGDGNRYFFNWRVTGFDDPSSDFYHDFGRGRDGWYLTSLSDPFGNSISALYYGSMPGPCWVSPSSGYTCGCTDPYFPCTAMQCPTLPNLWIPQTVTLPSGRTINILLDDSRKIQTFQFPVNGPSDLATWTLHHEPHSTTQAACTFNPPVMTTVYTLSAIDLPVVPALSYQFSYTPPSCPTPPVPPLLTQMTLPTGATVGYGWGTYSFYHGRQSRAGSCVPQGPRIGSQVIVSSPLVCAPQPSPQPNIRVDCDYTIDTYLDDQTGVILRTETVDGVPHATDYTQYAFPFGEQGTPSSDCAATYSCTGQSLTVVLLPADMDGRRRAKSVLFWSGPAGALTFPGDRVGAGLREAVFEGDPRPSGSITMPVCGGSNDYPFCPNHAVRVTFRDFEYETVSDYSGTHQNNRRMSGETTYYSSTQSNGSCPGCRFHAIVSSNVLGGTWESNGRHYDRETHSGNLGNDGRTITTTWTPANWTTTPSLHAPSLPNLYDQRTEADWTLTVSRYFEFDSATGFLNCTFLHDPLRQRVFFTRRYPSSDGSPSQDFSATATGFASPPYIGECTAFYPTSQPPVSSGPVIGTNGDAFGRIYTSQNGQLTSARWINGNSPAGWYAKNLVRDTTTGWIRFSSDTAGLWTSYTYDSLGRVTDIAPPDEADTVVRYPTATRTTATRNAGAGLSTYEQYDYDGLGRLIRERKLMPGSQYAKRFYAFDGAGNLYFKSDWVGDGTSETLALDQATSCASSEGPYTALRPSAAPGTYSLCFDPFGRARQVVGSSFSSLTTVDRTDGSTLYSDAREATTTYCINAALLTSGACGSGGFDAITTEVKDAFGRLTSVTEPDGAMITFTYDLNDKLTRVVQSGLPDRTFTYDPAGVLRSEFTPEKGVVSYDDYGSLGNLRRETEPDGLVRGNCYDFAGRLTEIRTSEDGVAPLCAYENQGAPAGRLYLSNAYDTGAGYSLGKLASRTATNYSVSPPPTVSDSYAYAGVGGRLSDLQTQVAGSQGLTATQGWRYNGLGLPAHHYHARATGTSPFVVSLGYDGGLAVTEYVNGIPMVTGIAYRASGVLASYTTGIGIGHDVATTILPDGSLPRPSSIATAGATSNFSTGTYGYDGAGNVRLMGLDSFGYDSRSRLISAALSGVGSQAYSYDRFGNLLAKGGNTFCSGSCSNNQIFGASYLRGNLTSYAGQTFTWDGLDRMSSSSQSSLTWSYLYDGSDERIAKIPPAGSWTFTIRDESKRVASEYSGTAASRDNVFLGNQLVLSYADAAVGGGGPVWTFYVSDHLGTPRLVTDVAGNSVENRRYWPYGDAVSAQSPFEALRFATMEFDAEGGTGPGLLTDRYYDHARTHVGGLGRFLTLDKIRGEESDAQSWNRYTYAGNNPLNCVDPNGKQKYWAQSVAAAVISFGSTIKSSGASLNEGGAVGIVADSTVTTVGSMVQETGDMFNLGTSIGEAIGFGQDSFNLAIAASQDAGRLGGWLLTVAGAAAAGEARFGTELVQRAMSNAELRATKETGLVRGGREGTHFVSDSVNSDALRARQRLALPQTPEARATLKVKKGEFSSPTKIQPKFGMPGGGMERTATGRIRVQVVGELQY